MKLLKQILVALLVMTFFSCGKSYDIVGTWSEVKKDTSNKGTDQTTTFVYVFNEDGSCSGELALQSGLIGGGKATFEGSYEIIGDSLILYFNSVKVMGVDASLTGNRRTGWKIIEADKNTIVYTSEGKKTEIHRME
jgi:hypothetical protein